MIGGLEADLQFLRLGIEQEKTHLCVAFSACWVGQVFTVLNFD